MKVILDKELEQEILDHFKSHEISLKKHISLDFSSVDLIQYVTVGGGLISTIKCLITYYEIKNKSRKLRIKNEDGIEIEIEASNIEELQKILQLSSEVFIENTETENKTTDK